MEYFAQFKRLMRFAQLIKQSATLPKNKFFIKKKKSNNLITIDFKFQ